MLKKVIATLLSMVMLFSATGAFAAVTTDPTGGTLKTDDFEQHNITADTEYDKTSFTSDVFSLFGNGSTPKGTIVYNGGKDGSKALKLSNAGTSLLISLSSVTGSTEYGVLSFDMKAGYNTTTKTVELGGRNEYGSYAVFRLGYDAEKQLGTIRQVTTTNTDGTVVATYSNDKWYKVVIRYKTGGAKDGWIIDETGTVIATASNTRSYTGSIPAITMNAAIDIIVDNAELRRYDTTKDAPKVTAAPSISGSNSVNTNTSSVTVVTDQPISVSKSSATLTGAGDTKTCTIAQDTTKYNTYTISWQGTLLGTTPYTLDLSGLKNSSGLAVGSSGSYTFTTAEAQIIANVVSSTPANGTENVSVDTKSMTVTFNTEMTAPQTVSLTGGITANVTTTDNKTFTFTWTEELAGLTTYSVSLADFEDADGVAPVTTSVSFKTETTEIVTLTDSFENPSNIGSAGTTYNGSLITVDAASTGSDVVVVEQVSGFTSDTNALQFKTGSQEANYIKGIRSTNEYEFTENETYIATWRFRLDKAATYDTANQKNGPMIAIGSIFNSTSSFPTQNNSSTSIQYKNGKLVIYSPRQSAGKEREISENKWYNITYVAGKNTEAIYFVDAETGELVYERQSNYDGNTRRDTTNYTNYFLLAYAARTKGSTPIYNDNQTFTIDDFTLWKIKPEKVNQKLALAGDVSEDDGTFVINFNQPVMADKDMFALYKDEAMGTAGALKNERCYIIPEVKYPDFCKTEVTFPNLEVLSDYTFDYSAMKGASGADLGEAKAASLVEFTTSAPDEALSVYGDITCDGMTNGSTIYVNMYSQKAQTVDIVASFYKRSFPAKLSTVVIEKGVSLTAGENTVEITLDKDIDADVVKLFVWNDMKKMVPIMEDYKALTPLDTLDILMIGSSLTEDTGRLFDGVLEASGHSVGADREIDITVRGVGGGHFTYHYNNLVREFEEGMDEAVRNNDADAIEYYVDEQQAIMDEEAANNQNSSRRLYFNYRNGTYDVENPKDKLLISALLEKQYDFITLQPSAHAYTTYEDYATELEYLTTKIRELQPNAEIILFQTWTHCYSNQNERHSYFIDGIKPFVDLWAENTSKYANITDEGQPLAISPVGYAFYLADDFYDWCGKRYNLSAGDNTAAAKTDLTDLFNASEGLLRDADHASYYGSFLSDAVWYEIFTGRKASVGTLENPAVPVPTGKGPELDKDGNPTGNTKTYFTITAEEHLERLEALVDIAHTAVSEYNNIKRIVK